MSLSSFSTGFVFIGIGILAIAIIALVIWITVLSSRLKRVTDALMAHPELEHAAAAGREGDIIAEDASATVVSGAAYEEIDGPGAMAPADTAVMSGTDAELAQQQAAEAQAMAIAEAQNAAAAEAQAAEMQAAQHYAAIQQRAAAAQQAAYSGAPYAQQQPAGYPYAGNAGNPYAGQQAASAGAQSVEAAQQQALNAACAQAPGAAQNAMTPAQQQAALAQQAAMRHMAAHNGSTFFDQRQPHDDGYSFDEGASDFFEGYRDSAGRQEKSFGRNTPLIPMGADRDVIEKRESYAEGALGGEYDLDSIDFSKVAGYRHPQR